MFPTKLLQSCPTTQTPANASPEELFRSIYVPLQLWLQQNGQDYPWSPAAAWSPASNSNSGKTKSLIALPPALPDSYAVWVSEVMLQQTRVETVKSYYTQWLSRWPSLIDLARAKEDQVLKQWEGLGYYNRAVNMLKCAQTCVQELGLNNLPQSFTELLSLPGIGPYIAAAVASISANQAILTLDTNVKRIFSRLYQQQPRASVEKQWLEHHSPALAFCLWRGSANISLIQLGQQLCKAKNPLCFHCPLQDLCLSAACGNWAKYPAPKSYQSRKLQSQRILLQAEGKYLLQRKRSGHLQHLWRLPEFSQLRRHGSELLGNLLAEGLAKYLGSFQHSYLQTQEKIQVFAQSFPLLCNDLLQSETMEQQMPQVKIAKPQWQPLNELSQAQEAPEWFWASPADLQRLTLAGPYRKFLQNLSNMQ